MTSYLENALQSAGLPTNGSRQEKIDRLVKHGAKNNNGPKPTISKAAGKKSDVKKTTDSNDKLLFFRENAPKVCGTTAERRKKLEAMWLALETQQAKSSSPYSVFDEELDIDFATSMGLKKVGEKDGQWVYKAINASSSKTTNPSPVSSSASPKANSPKAKSPKAKSPKAKSPKAKSPNASKANEDDNEDAKDDGAESLFRIFKCWLGSLSKPTLVAIAQDKKISVSGNKPDLVDKLMTSTGVTEDEDEDSDSDSNSSDSDGDEDNEDEEEDDEEEDDEEEDDEEDEEEEN